MFREAVAAAYGLHIPFLWIDSMCILQDNPEDFEVKAAPMRQVYSNLACNLSPTANICN